MIVDIRGDDQVSPDPIVPDEIIFTTNGLSQVSPVGAVPAIMVEIMGDCHVSPEEMAFGKIALGPVMLGAATFSAERIALAIIVLIEGFDQISPVFIELVEIVG